LNVGDAYRLKEIYDKLRQRVNSQLEADWCFNLTGGTKLMSLAATQAAADFNLPCVYYQTEAERQQQVGKLLYYRFEERRLIEDPSGGEVLLPLLTLDDYLRAHLDDYTCREQSDSKLEEAVYQALQPHVDEILCNVRPEGVKDQVEIDLLIRIGNQVGVIEVKSGGKGSGKKAVDQLTTAAAREYLGTYAQRFIVTQQAQEDRYKALANAVQVQVIELLKYRGGTRLDSSDQQKLLDAIQGKMPKPIAYGGIPK
jgi:Holliday junction resolvase-like predicted endonuclease